jgi:hypothetical protein
MLVPLNVKNVRLWREWILRCLRKKLMQSPRYNIKLDFNMKVRPGCGADHPPPSSAGVKKGLELYLYPPSGPVQACNGTAVQWTSGQPRESSKRKQQSRETWSHTVSVRDMNWYTDGWHTDCPLCILTHCVPVTQICVFCIFALQL